MKSFLKLVCVFLFCVMRVCTVSADSKYTLTKDGVLTIYAEKEGYVVSIIDLIKSETYESLVVSGEIGVLDMHFLELHTKQCISIDLTDAQIPFNMIMDQNFMDFEYLEEFKCPKTVTLIESWAFNNCPNLRTVVLPKALKKIECESFQNCPKLKVEIPKNVKIGEGAFRDSKVIRIAPIPEPEPEVPSCRFCSWMWQLFSDDKEKTL